ncbi:MAG: efflux RND transporter periplasmic adaptor subunit [Steroidobacteraceae bacterium]
MFGLRTLALAVGVWAATMNLTACTPSHSAQDPRTVPQLVQVALTQPAEAGGRAFTGVVSARVQSNLGFRISGKVIERLVDSGQAVHQGQPLMRLDRTDYTHGITAQVGNVDAARARLQQTAADEARYSGLVSSGAVSQSSYDQVKAAADSARAMLSAAEAQLKVAQNDGAYATLVSDADGTVIEALAEPGQFVSAGQIVVRVARAGAREAAVNLPETLRPALSSTAHATLYGANADSATRYPARLRQLSDAADPLTRTFEARYVLDGAAAKAPLGATVTVYLKESESAGALSVPLGAIDDEGRGPGVWLLDRQSSSVSYQSVRLIRFDGERAIVSAGIHIGDPIIAVGGHFLHEGQRVQVAEARVARE